MTNNLTDSTNPNRELFARLYAHIDFSTDEMLEEVRLNATVSRPMSARPEKSSLFGGGSSLSSAEVPATNLALGQRVMHQKFGEGTITNFEGSGQKARVYINFDFEGPKILIAGFANLQPL